jgi:hypothetical protein
MPENVAARGALALAVAALLWGCDVMGGGPSVAPPSNPTIPTPTPAPTMTPSPTASPTVAPHAARRRAAAGIR